MKILIKHDQSTIDPSASVSDHAFPKVQADLERRYADAIHRVYPNAEVEFEDSNDSVGIVISDTEKDQFQIETEIQDLLETVYEEGMFWQ